MIQVLKIGNKRILFKPSMKGGMLKGEEEEEGQIVTKGTQPISIREKETSRHEEREEEPEPLEDPNERMVPLITTAEMQKSMNAVKPKTPTIEKRQMDRRGFLEDMKNNLNLKNPIQKNLFDNYSKIVSKLELNENFMLQFEMVDKFLNSARMFLQMPDKMFREIFEPNFSFLLSTLREIERRNNREFKVSNNFDKENYKKLIFSLKIVFTEEMRKDVNDQYKTLRNVEYQLTLQILDYVEKNEERLIKFNEEKYIKQHESKEKIEKLEKELLESLPAKESSKKKPTISESSKKHYEEIIKAPEKEERIISHLPEKARPEITESEEDRQFREFNEHRIRVNEKKNKTKNKDYEPNYNNLKIELQSIATSNSLGLGFAFELACSGSGLVSGLLKSITSDSSEIVLTSVQNSLLSIQANISGVELNQLECFVYDLIQLKNIIECKNFNTNDYLLDINTRRVISDGVIKTFTIRGRGPTQTLPGMPITRTKFEGNDGFLPIFIEKNGKVTLYDILQQNPKTGSEIGYTLTHHDQQVIFFWYTKNGLISFNLTEDIMRNRESYTREHFGTTGTPLNTFTIKPNLPIDEVGHKGRGLNYYIPFDRLRYHNKLV